MADIFYVFEGKVYVNLTNKCSSDCTFCIRKQTQGVGTAQTLWHKDGDPTWEQVKKAIDDFNFEGVKTVVFCGYGEPTCAFDNLIAASKYIKQKHPDIKLRINTNGQSDLINGKPTADEICKVVDSVSISLNGSDAEKYNAVTRSKFGLKAYDAMINFAERCKENGLHVRFTAVDVVSDEELEKCAKVAENMGIEFCARKFTKGDH